MAVTHAVFALGLAIDARGLIIVSSDWAGRVCMREIWSHCPVAQKKGEVEGRPRQSKKEAAVYHENASSFAAGAPGLGTGPGPPAQVRPHPCTVSSGGSALTQAEGFSGRGKLMGKWEGEETEGWGKVYQAATLS